MRACFRPTWVTGVVVLAPVGLVPVLRVLRFDATLYVVGLLTIEIPFSAFQGLGLPVGRRGDWFGFALPNALGWMLLALANLAAFYLLGSAVSAAWTRARARRSRGAAR